MKSEQLEEQFNKTKQALENYTTGNVDGAHPLGLDEIVVDDVAKYHALGQAVDDELKKLLRSIREAFQCDPCCPVCLGKGHVCENHSDKAWYGVFADDDLNPQICRCGGAAMPCDPEKRQARLVE